MSEVSSFEGFPRKGLSFFKDLTENNNRDWFEAHKTVYLDDVVSPAVQFVAEFGARLQKISKGITFDTRTNGSGSIMRIYRDVRFSKDKTPYKTNLGINFWLGERKKMENPGFHFWMDADGAWLYGGFYHFPKPFLDVYRQAVSNKRDAKALLKAMEDVRAAGKYEIGGDQSKTVPRGYDKQYEYADLLRYTGMHVSSPKIPKKAIHSAELIDLCFEHAKNMSPVFKWFVKVDSQAN